MNLNEVLELYASGFACGVLLSVLPFIIGEIIRLAFTIMMKGEHKMTEATGIAAVTEALTTGISAIATDAMSAIGSVVPVALPIAGAIIVVGIGFKVFKKVTGR